MNNLYFLSNEKKMANEAKTEAKAKWDGSYLSSIGCKDVTIEYKDGNFAIVTIKDLKIEGYVNKVKSSLPAIIDELKPIFQLLKTGTHLFYSGRSLYLINKCDREHDTSLKDLEKEDHKLVTAYLKKQVQNILAFRDVVGVKGNNEGHIIVRREKGKVIKAYSIKELYNEILKDNSKLSSNMVKKWFDDRSLKDVIKELINYHEEDDNETYVVEYLKEFRELIEEKVLKIDKEYVWIVSYIIERIARMI